MLSHMPCLATTKLCFSYFNLPDNMAQKAFLRLLMLFLAFSYVLSISAVPTTRSLMSNKEDPSVKDLLAQDAMDLKDGEELLDVGEGFIEGRMDFETTDYKGVGANPEHEPKTPGKP